MAGGKSTKRVNLRTKLARRQQADHNVNALLSPSSAATGAPSHTAEQQQLHQDHREGHRHSHTPAAHANEEERQTALHIRDALRQRQGKTVRAPLSASKNTRKTSSRHNAVAAASNKEEDMSRLSSKTSKKDADGAESKFRRKKNAAKKESTAATHPAAQRRAALQERRRLLLPVVSAAESRMASAQAELSLFDKVQSVPAYVADPFAAVMQHLSTTMDTLKPQTADVGRVARE